MHTQATYTGRKLKRKGEGLGSSPEPCKPGVFGDYLLLNADGLRR